MYLIYPYTVELTADYGKWLEINGDIAIVWRSAPLAAFTKPSTVSDLTFFKSPVCMRGRLDMCRQVSQSIQSPHPTPAPTPSQHPHPHTPTLSGACTVSPTSLAKVGDSFSDIGSLVNMHVCWYEVNPPHEHKHHNIKVVWLTLAPWHQHVQVSRLTLGPLMVIPC